MSEEVTLDAALQAQLLELEKKLEIADHFTLLGVPPGAAPAVAKAAFFALSLKFHPDRHFRKNLGSFRPVLEKVFKALSKAHQTVTHPEKRETYLAAHPELRPPPPAPKREPMKRMTWKKQDLPLTVVEAEKSRK